MRTPDPEHSGSPSQGFGFSRFQHPRPLCPSTAAPPMGAEFGGAQRDVRHTQSLRWGEGRWGCTQEKPHRLSPRPQPPAVSVTWASCRLACPVLLTHLPGSGLRPLHPSVSTPCLHTSSCPASALNPPTASRKKDSLPSSSRGPHPLIVSGPPSELRRCTSPGPGGGGGDETSFLGVGGAQFPTDLG